MEVSRPEGGVTRLYYGFRALDFSDPTGGQIEIDNRDARTNLIGIDHAFFRSGGAFRLDAGYRLDLNDAEGDDFDFVGHAFLVRSEVRLPWRMRLAPKVALSLRDYLHSGGEGKGERRRDETLQVALRWTRGIGNDWEAFATLAFLRNFSLAPFAYERWIGGLGITWKW